MEEGRQKKGGASTGRTRLVLRALHKSTTGGKAHRKAGRPLRAAGTHNDPSALRILVKVSLT
jgi:hypothetical protein